MNRTVYDIGNVDELNWNSLKNLKFKNFFFFFFFFFFYINFI